MSLRPGARLGPYEILGALGAGGMGEVYRARDTRLERTVAIKTLSAEWSQDPERRSRFEREAKAVAALTHAHICTLYDVGHHEGVDFLVMELLEGETMAARLERGPLPLAEVLAHAVQIADALDQAHRRGIVHRDLKPANIMLTRSGVKLLDFGLAKLRSEAVPVADGVTVTSPLTTQGQILGTLPYMAPEQLESKPVDARTDLFAFGAIVHEMATGRRAFGQSSQASLIGALMHTVPPPLADVAPGAPPALSRLVSVCLSKDPQDRWSSAHDVLLQLREISASAEVVPASQGAKPDRARLAWGVAALATLATIALTVLLVTGQFSVPPAAANLDVLSVVPAEGTTLVRSDAPQISPDGRRIAFVATDRLGRSGLYVRSLDSAVVRSLADTEGATMPFWSPDSGSLGFFADGQLKTVALAGGAAHAIALAPIPRGGSWSREDLILFSAQPNLPPFIVPAAGGERTPVPMAEGAIPRRLYPRFLPDGRHYLYLLVNNAQPTGRVVSVASIDSEEATELVQSRTSAGYASGHLLFRRDATLVAQPFDLRTLTLSGAPTPIAEDVGVNHLTYQGLFTASDTGALAYQRVTPGSELVWFDRQGRRVSVAGPSADYNTVCLTSDGRIVYDLADPASGSIDLFALDVGGDRPSRLTFDPAIDFYAVCSPNGADIAFASLRDGQPNLFRLSLNSPGSEQVILREPLPDLVTDWTRDGLIVYSVLHQDTNFDIEAVPAAGGPAMTVVATAAEERNGRVSPDGRWIAYVSNESGPYEVYVQAFPPTGAKWQVSTGGGHQPQWRNDGRELFYVSPDRKLIGVAVSAGAEFAPGTAVELFDTRITSWERANQGVQYAVTADGQRFLVNTAAETIVPITLVLNWTAATGR